MPWKLFASTLAVVAAAVGCSFERPLREGPQLREFPDGFMYDANMSGGRPVFADRPVVRQRGYMTPREPGGNILITQYPGPSTEADVRAARAALEGRYSYPEYGPIESLALDRHPAWGWSETQRLKGEVAAEHYKAVVSYDDATYTIEFYADDPSLRDIEKLKQVVSTFVVGKKG